MMHSLKRYIVAALLVVGGLSLMSSLTLAAQQIPEVRPATDLVERAPSNPALPTIFIVGDSTADFHYDMEHEASAGVQGWGVFLQSFFDPQLVNVVNAARGGRSSRTYITEGFWDNVLSMMKPKDIVLIQLGQNDVFPINDTTRARGTLPGIGSETEEIENGVTHHHEVVHTYGWYLRQIIQQTKARGARPIVLSLTPKNIWKDGHVGVGAEEYRTWAREVTKQEGNVDFVDVSAIMDREYEKLGQEKVAGLYHAKESVHMTTPGAYLASELIVSGLKSLLDAPVSRYLSRFGQMVTPADELAFHWPANPKVSTLWILGDSTVRNGDGTGAGGMWGWGDRFALKVDPTRLNVANVAVGGLSSRTNYTMHWPLLLPNIRRGDFVLMQFGHNDLGDPADPTRARASLSGIGDESKLIHNPITGKDEEVHTYGWYLRQIIVEARKAGATPIVCSPVPRNNWIGNKVKQAEPVLWAKQVAADEHASFIDLNADVARRYEELGPKSTKDLFADVTTHTTLEGAELTAASVMQDLIASGPAELRSSLISSGK